MISRATRRREQGIWEKKSRQSQCGSGRRRCIRSFRRRASLKLDADQITTLLNHLKKVTAAEAITDYDSLSDYGLDQPQNTITVTCGDETTTIDIGDYNEMLSEYYVKVSGDEKVYLMDSTLKDAFSKTADTMVVQEDSTETEK